jgi:hypothetical protein
MRRSASLLFLGSALAVGCAPYDAELKGSWHVWLAANSSNIVKNDDLAGLESQSTHYECSRTYDADKGRWADGYIGPRESDGMEMLGYGTIAQIDAGEISDPRSTAWQSEKYVGGACQSEQVAGADTPDDPSDDYFALLSAYAFPRQDDNPDTEEDESQWAEIPPDEELVDYPLEAMCTQEMMRKFVEDCEPVKAASGGAYFLDQDGYYAMKGSLEPWRTEALLTGEGELQLSFHQEIEGEDWQLIWTIDPDFKPESCVSTEDGNAEVVPVHGSSWLEEWSADEDGYTIYYVNSGAYHSPDRGSTLWYYPADWVSGFGYAKFIGEEFLNVQPRVRNSIAAIDTELAYEDLDENGIPDEQEAFIADEQFNTLTDAAEWVEIAGASSGDWMMEVKLEDNLWRPLDPLQGGLDGWTERNYSWVRIKDGSDVKEGGSVQGDFQITMSGLESNSQMVVRGEFKVDELKVDKWAYPVLEDELRADEDGQAYCK